MKKRLKSEAVLHETLAFAFGGSKSGLFRSPFFNATQPELEFIEGMFSGLFGLVRQGVETEGFGGNPVYADHGPYLAWGEK